MILDQLEKAFMVIGNRVIMASGGQQNFDDFEIKNENVTNELVVKPRPLQQKRDLETRKSLNNMTKKAICELCIEIFGIDLNFRIEKKLLITEFLLLQDKYS